MTFTRPLGLSDCKGGQSEKDVEILKASEGIERLGFLELSKGGRLRAKPPGLIVPHLGFVRGCYSDGEKKTVNILKGKEVQINTVSWKSWEKNRTEQQRQMPLKPHRCDHKILSQSKGRKQGNQSIKNKNS